MIGISKVEMVHRWLCPICGGTGLVTKKVFDKNSHVLVYRNVVCNTCLGVGTILPQQYFQMMKGELLEKYKVETSIS